MYSELSNEEKILSELKSLRERSSLIYLQALDVGDMLKPGDIGYNNMRGYLRRLDEANQKLICCISYINSSKRGGVLPEET